jgi:Uma2 family endonuclease
MQLILNDVESQAPVILHPPPMTDDEFFDFCQLYPDFRIERSAEGEVIILPGTGLETSFRDNELSRQLANWARADGRGKAFESNAEFMLPSGAAMSPDASWIDNSRLAKLTREQKRKFTLICPDFAVELTSPSDRLSRVQQKMIEWIENSVQLGWLLDADNRTAYVYRPECALRPLCNRSGWKVKDPSLDSCWNWKAFGLAFSSSRPTHIWQACLSKPPGRLLHARIGSHVNRTLRA